MNQIEDCISFDKKDKVFRSHMEKGIYKPQFENNQLNCYLKRKSIKDIAYHTQNALEKVVCDFFKKLPGKKLNIFLAGGVFANVKLNQRIKDLKNFIFFNSLILTLSF